MGLSDALRNRLALARGESLAETIRIFLAPKAERRKLAARKFPGRAVPTGGRSRDVHPPVAVDMVAELLDIDWYAGANGLPPSGAAGHFLGPGLAGGFAPRAALAGPDGRHLSPRGAELLHRMGLPLGAVPRETDDPDGLDPWAIGNPHRKALAVVTAITSAEERLLPVPPEWRDGADFYVLTDFGFDATGPWRTVRPVFHHLDPGRVAGFAQTHLPTFFPAYARVLWLDPGVLCCADPAAIAEASPAALSCFRIAGRPPAAEAAAATREVPGEVADFVGGAADHPGFAGTGLLDPSVLLIDPSDEGVRALMARVWRNVTRGAGSDRLAFTLAAAETPDLVPGDLPGGALAASPAFAAAGSA